MTDKEIVLLAQNDAREKRRTVLPKNFGALETMLYQQIYYLCRDYDEGNIPKDEARRLKTQYINDYGRICLKRDIYDDHAKRRVKISQLLTEADKNGCDICRRVSRVFDGREPVRDTSDKTHGILVEIIRQAKRDYSQDYTDRTEDEYIAQAVMDSGFYERVEVQE